MTGSEHPPSDAENSDLPALDETIQCRGCEHSRRWENYDVPPEDVEAVATCPNCETHILGFNTVTPEQVKEFNQFMQKATSVR